MPAFIGTAFRAIGSAIGRGGAAIGRRASSGLSRGRVALKKNRPLHAAVNKGVNFLNTRKQQDEEQEAGGVKLQGELERGVSKILHAVLGIKLPQEKTGFMIGLFMALFLVGAIIYTSVSQFVLSPASIVGAGPSGLQ